jgi:diguanylate cyclase (GGDEF)-like protein
MRKLENMKSSIMRWLIMTLIMFSGQLLANQQELPVSELIEKCQSLEDDKPQDAIKTAVQVINKINKLNSPINYGHALGCMGWSYAVLDQLEKSREVAYELEKLAIGLNESEHSITLLRRAGSVFHRVGDRVSASENYQAAMLDAEKLNLVKEKIPLLVNLGVLNSEIRAHKKAIDNYYQAIGLMKKVDDYNYHAPVLYNLAVTLKGQSRFEESLDAFLQVEAMINEHWPKQRVLDVYFGLATSYSGIEQHDQAMKYIEKVIELRGDDEESSIFSHSFDVFQARIKLNFGDDGSALQVADAAADYFLKNENVDLLTSANNPLNSLADLYEALDMQKEALKIHKKSREVEQQLQDSFNRKTLAQMQARLQNSQQSEELAILKSKNQQDQLMLNKTSYQRSMMMITIGFLLTVLVLILLWQNHSKRQLIKLTTTDPLTLLKNRRGITLWNERHKLPQPPEMRYLWLIDIDHFRKINDELGHDAGDTALKKLAEVLSGFKNVHRCLGRWGGEEFLMLSQDLSQADVQKVADDILTAIGQTNITHGIHTFSLNASIGISVIKDTSEHMWNRAISQADKALYVAKDRGRNCMVMATDF